MECQYCYEISDHLDEEICLDCQEDHICKECYVNHGMVTDQEPICMYCSHIQDIDSLKLQDLTRWLDASIDDEIFINSELNHNLSILERYIIEEIIPQFSKQNILNFLQNNPIQFDQSLLPQALIYSLFLYELEN